jgi:hypothetical protein
MAGGNRMVEELFARARAAVEAARTQNRRTALLTEFVRRGRPHSGELPMRCAWCGRLSLADEFVEPAEFLAHGVPDEIDGRSSHGICPECLERELGRRS